MYPGEREAGIVDWVYARVIDARGTAFPRETILLGNRSKARQLARPVSTTDSHGSLIGRDAVREAFSEVSRLRCETYLAEFPWLQDHFDRFAGKTQVECRRVELNAIMEGLRPSGLTMLNELHEVGIIRPVDGPVATATRFEIPRLYRQGLGLVVRGRA